MKWAESEIASRVEWLKKNKYVRECAKESGDKVRDISLERVLYYDHQTDFDEPREQFAFYMGMIQAYLDVQKHLTTKTTNHIVIVPKRPQSGQVLFEDIQNKYSLFDNCVIEEDGKRIVIEGTNLQDVTTMYHKIMSVFRKRVMAAVINEDVPMTESIIDDGRDGETGGMEV